MQFLQYEEIRDLKVVYEDKPFITEVIEDMSTHT